MDRELPSSEDEDIQAWSLRLQALAELRSLAGVEERPDVLNLPDPLPQRDSR